MIMIMKWLMKYSNEMMTVINEMIMKCVVKQ